ncbi:MAG TPA: tetratricopeptide repeat protein [Thermoanaerobaculia bacterium]|jgi:cytochrome c-type biogenesis protein CcmH/NrfG
MTGSTDWMSVIAILAGGLILGGLFIYFFSKGKTRTLGSDVDVEQRDLEAKRDLLLQQLRDPDTGAEERTRLEIETAQVLRAIDEHGARRRPAASHATDLTAGRAGTMDPTFKGFLWGVASTSALFFLGWFVMQTAKPRAEGESMVGGGPPMAAGQQPAQQPAANDPAVQQLEAAVKSNPNDLRLRNQLAQAYLERENLMAVFEQTKFVLERAPNDSTALTYQALVRMAMGQTEEAGTMLEKATSGDGQNLDAWVALAWLRTQQGQSDAAAAAIAEAIKTHPEQKARLDQVLVEMRKAAAAQAQTAEQQPGGNQLPPDHPPLGTPTGGAPAVSPAPAAGPSIKVTIQLDPSARARVAAGGVVYLIARAAGVSAGPPVAVKRIPASSLPLTVDLSSADSMMGQPLPARVRIEARLDNDGDAASRNPTDPIAVQDGVAPGATVTLALK